MRLWLNECMTNEHLPPPPPKNLSAAAVYRMPGEDQRSIYVDGRWYFAGDALWTHWVDQDGVRVCDFATMDKVDLAFLARRRAAQAAC
jgi:hypothetical protein